MYVFDKGLYVIYYWQISGLVAFGADLWYFISVNTIHIYLYSHTNTLVKVLMY